MMLPASLLLLLCFISRASTQGTSPSQTTGTTATATATTNTTVPTPTFNYQQDRFPEKIYVDPQGSLGFTVEYYKYYKVVTDTTTDARYALVCCGLNVDSAEYHGVFNVPVQSIVAMDVRSIAFIELLQSGELIKAVGAPSNMTSVCVYNYLKSNLAPFHLLDSNATSGVDIVFSQTPFNNSKVVTVNITSNLTPLEQAKWIYFYATFLNQEGLALNIYQNIQNQYNCHKYNVDSVSKQLLAWVNYDPTASVWHVKNDMYSNTLLADAGGEPLVPSDGATFSNINLAAFHKAMDDVQLVIDSTPFSAQQNNFGQWQTISGYVPNQDVLNETFIVQKSVWRTDGLVNEEGYDDWSERSVARPDLALQDAIAIQYPTYQPGYRRTWFRNFARGDNPLHTEYLPIDCSVNANIFPSSCILNPFIAPTNVSVGDNSNGNSSGGGLSRGGVAGIAVGVTVGAVGILLVSYLAWRKRSDPNHPWLNIDDGPQNSGFRQG